VQIAKPFSLPWYSTRSDQEIYGFLFLQSIQTFGIGAARMYPLDGIYLK